MYWPIGPAAPACRSPRARWDEPDLVPRFERGFQRAGILVQACGAGSCGAEVSLGSFLKEPLQGKTSLSAVFWLYGFVGSILVSAIGLAVDPGNEFAMRVYTAFGLLFSVYVTVATYQCASNCQSKFLARLARISAVASLVALPVLAYLYYSGAIGVALVTLGGEQ
jgi:hypothetical protein